jgi:hypothetical protein
VVPVHADLRNLSAVSGRNAPHTHRPTRQIANPHTFSAREHQFWYASQRAVAAGTKHLVPQHEIPRVPCQAGRPGRTAAAPPPECMRLSSGALTYPSRPRTDRPDALDRHPLPGEGPHPKVPWGAPSPNSPAATRLLASVKATPHSETLASVANPRHGPTSRHNVLRCERPPASTKVVTGATKASRRAPVTSTGVEHQAPQYGPQKPPPLPQPRAAANPAACLRYRPAGRRHSIRSTSHLLTLV